MRRFTLHRDVDVSGVSGPGVVADGVLFDNNDMTVTWPNGDVTTLPAGWVRLIWRGRYSSIVLWSSLEDAMAVHGHDGLTRVVWSDEPESEQTTAAGERGVCA